VHGQSVLPLGIYQYPTSLSYRIRIIKGSDKGVYMLGDKLYLGNGFKSCKLRAELRDDPNIYDEIEIVNLNFLDILSYNILSSTEHFYFKCYNKLSKFIY
jgi:hypothetical protein